MGKPVSINKLAPRFGAGMLQGVEHVSGDGRPWDVNRVISTAYFFMDSRNPSSKFFLPGCVLDSRSRGPHLVFVRGSVRSVANRPNPKNPTSRAQNAREIGHPAFADTVLNFGKRVPAGDQNRSLGLSGESRFQLCVRLKFLV